MIQTRNKIALDTGFAQGFLETTRAYLADDKMPRSARTAGQPAPGMNPLPVIERGAGPRRMLHVLGPDCD